MTAMTSYETRIQHLLESARNKAWQADADIDWQLKAALPWWMPKALCRRIVSQFYHGELLTAQACQELAESFDGVARAFLLQQAEEEQRHARAYWQYAQKLGGIAPVNRSLQESMAEARLLQEPAARIIAYHVLLESEALYMQQTFIQYLKCPLFEQINRRVARDEARHVAFGRTILPVLLADYSEAQHQALYQQSQQLWQRCVTDQMQEFCGPLIRVAMDVSNNWLKERWQAMSERLAEAGLHQPHEALQYG